MHVPSAVATKSVGEKASPLPLLSVGASVPIFDRDGPWVASQCKLPVYSISTLTMPNYGSGKSFRNQRSLLNFSCVRGELVAKHACKIDIVQDDHVGIVFFAIVVLPA